MNKKLTIVNLLSVLLVIVINYVSQARYFNDITIGEISRQYNTLFTPAGYAFSIWGIIFLSLFAYVIFQIRRVFFSKKDSDFVTKTGYWFFIANLLNSLWVLAFTYDYTGLSVLLMIGILFSLIQIILKTNMERWDAPISIIAFVWWPICLYSGWISVATIANIATYLVKINWSGFGISSETWVIVLIIAAIGINISILIKRNMREFVLVGIWALVAIYIRHKDTYQSIAITALAGSILLILLTTIHAYKNKDTNPFKKLNQ
ncbi:tryptophan-rich sensory protein [Aquimarina muelleri]|uniref:tryptophan-rich sensory protein n=1 Tax=Aquimarina muelleri TaxID=279356 RepID=UPI003F6857C7